MDLHSKEKKRMTGDWFLLFFAVVILFASAGFFSYTKYPSFFKSNSKIEKRNEVSPQDPVVINFSKPVIKNYFGWKLEIYPQTDFNYRWENKNKRLVITPKKYWNPESEYRITVSGKNCLLASINNDFYFKTILYPGILEFYPASGSKDILLDIEDPIRATFDKSLDDFKVKFVIDPFKELNYEAENENNQISLMPKEDLERGKKYTIDAYVRYKDEEDDKYRKIGGTFFEIKSIPPPQIWEKDFALRLEQAKKFTEPQIREGKYIDINLKSQVMTIFEEGELLDAYMVSTGKRGMETKEGQFAISNKTRRAWSKKYGLFMPYWMALVRSGEFGIHELPEWPGGYKEGQNHLGTPVSHGCVRLGVGPAERVYNFADIGTPVVVHY